MLLASVSISHTHTHTHTAECSSNISCCIHLIKDTPDHRGNSKEKGYLLGARPFTNIISNTNNSANDCYPQFTEGETEAQRV